ncbi:FxsA family protein [Desulfovibrio ferrophilus]|uniref:FxsA cytoplasmic membrane protein n=1 Tax=Desulfovibrio ferrophilus TaxID=241368 RepID=A0A2Z6AZI4_9BACT|nr:FxsA family protein [Desulfovibrio ferrophilus]BBD08681.1 FxsA cytoplasmic membrane protein [Desulfovibrio ferrophilus]
MVFRLFLAFATVPLIEIYLLMKVGSAIGAEATIAIVLLTGFAGAWLARAQGVSVLNRMRADMNRGVPPTGQLVDAALILVAGVVLLTPGFATDIMGLLLLIPPVRAKLKEVLGRKLADMAQNGHVTVIHR